MKEVKQMKKMFILVLFSTLILSACNSSKLSFSEIKNVPRNIEEHIDSHLKLQSINDGTKGYYIIFHSNGKIEANLDPQNNIVNIIFNELNPHDKDIKRNVYYLTIDSTHDTINVLVNGEEIPFDEATIL